MYYFLLHLFLYAEIVYRYAIVPLHVSAFPTSSHMHIHCRLLYSPLTLASVYRGLFYVVHLLNWSGLTILDTVVPLHYWFPNVSDIAEYSYYILGCDSLSLADICWRFGEIHCLHLQDRRMSPAKTIKLRETSLVLASFLAGLTRGSWWRTQYVLS
jgi:hypothetical protein